MKWVPVFGSFKVNKDTIDFKGGTVERDGQVTPLFGNLLGDLEFAGGTIAADVEFAEVTPLSACELIVSYDPKTNQFLTAGLGSGALAAVRGFVRSQSEPYQYQWSTFASVGDRNNLVSRRSYHVELTVKGSRLMLSLDGVHLIDFVMPVPLPRAQIGIWALGESDIRIRNFTAVPMRPKAFVVMQFTAPYNDLYAEVIKPVCDQMEMEAFRADDTVGPGVIIADIVKQIDEANLVIADITPTNANVFYEVGYAHARKKPTILIAEADSKLPFDVSGLRTLFYENTISGKKKIEDGLRSYISAIMSP